MWSYFVRLKSPSHMFLLFCFITFLCLWTLFFLVRTPVFREKVKCTDETEGCSYSFMHYGNDSLIDLRNFHYIINNRVCDSYDNVFLVILIHSAANHFELRKTIRHTWGTPEGVSKRILLVFLLAQVSDETVQSDIERESEQSRDIIQGSFKDAYRNLTYKHVMGLKWVSTFCTQAEFVMKMDDDIFVEIYRLVHLLGYRKKVAFNGRPRAWPAKTLGCFVQEHMPVVRDPTSKWYVSFDEYPRNNFINYCSGWAYLMTPDVAGALEKESGKFKYFWVDDVHVTGTISKSAGIRYNWLNRYYTIETGNLVEWARSTNHYSWHYIFAPTWGDIELMEMAHKKALNCFKKDCICCFPTSTKHSLSKSVSNATPKLSGTAKVVRIG
ncbi:beta-1,3-galactosyltransferase 5-like [Limulus polyphemus]|uniref:Hexosyltransferase n=1 Tax=Limulus polyphemus TaxID=6850 RepID=A0ABM1B4B3_LIMPO|nr:beta-1,3-galactosyltransferase 5-like [Limulus polyphemus]